MRKTIIFLLILNFNFILPLSGCGSADRKNSYSEPDEKKPLVDDKYSITADRKKLDEIRAQVPVEKKTENDELALILQLTTEVKKSPSEIRSVFDKVVRKKREVFDKDLKKERESFVKKEKKDRDDFLKKQVEMRENFNREKSSKEDRNSFYKESETRRQEYFSNEREKRNDFESDMRDKRKNFDDYIREKNNEFNQEYRSYSRRYDEMKKVEREAKAEKKKQEFSKMGNSEGPNTVGVKPFNPMDPEAGDLDRELDEIRKRQGSPLGSGE